MFRTSVAGLLLVVAAVAVASPPCPKGHGFWDTNRQECAQCKVCSHNEVVLMPCQPYKDTLCGPMSALNIKWPWRQPAAANPGRPSTSTSTTTSTTTTAAPPPTRLYVFSTRKMRPLSRRVTTADDGRLDGRPSTSSATEEGRRHHTGPLATVAPPPPSPSSTTEAASSTTEAASSTTEAPTTKVSAQPFLQTETTLEWDWQALALAVIIAAFVVLLVIFAVYAAVHARRATNRRRRVQKELDAAQLSLFPVTSGHDAELQTLSSPSSPKGMFKANQCLYLEKLLEQKQTRRANIYVETGRQATPAPARRSSRWKEKPTAARTPC
ncbi:Hypothetical predicted protein [Cloeon dipterum]|uniref:TNFR-Cys domain-containing protein n=1 Tax=Cloeon dipterum TaxID=197152 RepID=A0A8S1D572_9INSE|nr:Hypothetical predicted protein [Cloeon dipterum]